MHMADALLSPAVGGAMWAASAATIACCSARLRARADEGKVPLMAVLGAFVFAAQMINFSIPGTGSSGHLAGGLLLSILLGPAAALLTIASVLTVQALFFADGGLLALGCNIFNLGFVPAFVVFPLVYRNLMGRGGSGRCAFATVISALAAFQLGALAVVAETACSGISSLPARTFLLLMQPIHLAIGLVEGIVTVAVLSFVRQKRPDVLPAAAPPPGAVKVVALLAAAIFAAGALSSIASTDPDGLEWSVARVLGKAGVAAPEGAVHRAMAALQEKTARFRDYRMGGGKEIAAASAAHAGEPQQGRESGVTGLVGTVLTLFVVLAVGLLLKKRVPNRHGIH